MKRPDAIQTMLFTNGINCQRLQEILGITEKTAYKKIRDPFTWTTKELALLRKAGVRSGDITEAIRQII